MVLLPARLFEGLLPNAFVSHYTHWYERDKDEVIFRDNANPWLAREEEWRLQRNGTAWRLVKGTDALVNIASKSARTLMQIFRPLEDTNHIHAIWNFTSGTLEVLLPRLQLDFYILQNDDQMRSRQYRTMSVALNQNVGTLVGLTSKLILRGASEDDCMVLVPVPKDFGPESLKYTKSSSLHHIDITIARTDATRICAYTLDSDLGRIIDSGDLQSRLLLAYLHALTSHCLPDPFTGLTGTESALSILRSASTRSFETLTTDEVSILTSIARLTPARTMHAENTEQIHWDPNLTALSQSPEFYNLVKDIFDQAQRTAFFYPGSESVDSKKLPNINKHLQERDMIRSSTFRIDGYGGEKFTSKADKDYDARDANTTSERGQRAFTAAALVVRDCAALHEQIPRLRTGLFETHLKHFPLRSSNGRQDVSSLCFDTKWLGDSSSLLAEEWCSLHSSLPKTPKNTNRFNIMLWLSTMAYSTSANMEALHTFGAFYRVKEFASVKPPTASSSFNLSRGDKWVTAELTKIIGRFKKPIAECPEGSIPKHNGEQQSEYNKRKTAVRRKPLKEAIDKFVAALRNQWPCADPSTPSAKEIKVYINVSEAMTPIKSCFGAWYDNQRFTEYLDRISAVMSKQNPVPVSPPQHILTAPVKADRMSEIGRAHV